MPIKLIYTPQKKEWYTAMKLSFVHSFFSLHFCLLISFVVVWLVKTCYISENFVMVESPLLRLHLQASANSILPQYMTQFIKSYNEPYLTLVLNWLTTFMTDIWWFEECQFQTIISLLLLAVRVSRVDFCKAFRGWSVGSCRDFHSVSAEPELEDFLLYFLILFQKSAVLCNCLK